MQLLYKCRPWFSAELLILTVLQGGHKNLSDILDCYQRGWLKFLRDSDMQFWDAWWIWVHFTKAWFSLPQVVVGTRQICQSKTNWESFFRLIVMELIHVPRLHVFTFSFQSIVNSHRFVFFCLPAVGNCGCQGDRQETGQLRGNSATEAHGNGFAAVFRSDDHPSRHCSPAWQLWNVICVPACSVVHTCIWARGATGTALCVCLYSIFTNVYWIQRLQSLYLWFMRERTNLNSGDLSCSTTLHSAHRSLPGGGPERH